MVPVTLVLIIFGFRECVTVGSGNYIAFALCPLSHHGIRHWCRREVNICCRIQLSISVTIGEVGRWSGGVRFSSPTCEWLPGRSPSESNIDLIWNNKMFYKRVKISTKTRSTNWL